MRSGRRKLTCAAAAAWGVALGGQRLRAGDARLRAGDGSGWATAPGGRWLGSREGGRRRGSGEEGGGNVDRRGWGRAARCNFLGIERERRGEGG
jgi:hypothetical protein